MGKMNRKITLWTLGVISILTISAVSVLADPINLQANTTATFGAGSSGAVVNGSGCTAPCITATNASGTSTITYSAAAPQINVTLNPGEISNVTLGVLTSTSTATAALGSGPSFSGATIQLTVTFTVPGGLSPQTFSGVLTGTVISTASGSIVQWTSPTTLTFNSPTAGTITLTIESFTPISAPSNPNPNRIRATISVTGPVIPEPSTLFLLGGGLFGLAAATRKMMRRGKARS